MSYATYDNFEKLMGKLELTASADDDSDGVPERDLVVEALAQAQGVMNGVLAQAGITVPVAAPTPGHVWCECAIAQHIIRAPRNKTTEDSRRAHEQAMEWLNGMVKTALTREKIAASGGGDDGGSGPLPDDPALYAPVFASEPRVFTRKTTGGLF